VLREGLTNAAKYSIDGQVEVTIGINESDGLVLGVTNRFNPDLPQDRAGFGTAILDENATSWSRTTSGKQFALTATFASL